MTSQAVFEIIGYVGSVLIVASLAMSSIIRLRIVNLAGASVFAVYGALIGSAPIILTNAAITILDLWYLRRELTTREDLSVVSVEADDPFLAAFLDRYGTDMETFADQSVPLEEAEVHFVMLRDANPAGVFLGTWRGGGEIRVIVDYVAPPYRDLRSGACLYDGERFAALGAKKLVVETPDRRQGHYLLEMGYEERDDGSVVKMIDREDANSDADLSPMVPDDVPDNYPRELEQWIDTPDGDRIFLRPVVPDDIARLENAFAHGDVDTIRRRFFTAAPPADRAHLEYLTILDFDRRLALLAMDGEGNSIGITRYEPESATRAEIAIVVAPDWRRRGIASLLVESLEEPAIAHGFTELGAIYLPSNKAVESMLMSIGYANPKLDDGVVRLTKVLE